MWSIAFPNDPIVEHLPHLRSKCAVVSFKNLLNDVEQHVDCVLLRAERSVLGDLVFNCFYHFFDARSCIERFFVFFAARAAALFVVDFAHSVQVGSKVHGRVVLLQVMQSRVFGFPVGDS